MCVLSIGHGNYMRLGNINSLQFNELQSGIPWVESLDEGKIIESSRMDLELSVANKENNFFLKIIAYKYLENNTICWKDFFLNWFILFEHLAKIQISKTIKINLHL